jgi:hypothetical protein
MYCQCGCGKLAPIAKKTRRGYMKGESMRFVLGHHLRTAEYKAALYTEQRNAKISAAHADGRIPFPVSRPGNAHPSWRGADIGYAQAHFRVVSRRGQPVEHLCAGCFAKPADEWAINHSYPMLRYGLHSGLVKAFSPDVMAYVPFCRSCHRKADRRGGFRG